MTPRTPLNPENDLEGYDESQRAEIHEFEGGGPVDGVIRTDMAHDRGGDLDTELDGEAPELPDGYQDVAGTGDPDGDGEDADIADEQDDESAV